MKKLSEYKNFFQCTFFNCLDEKGFDKSPFDCTERAQYETLVTTLKFIYGAEFENIRPTWTQETLNEYYSSI